MMRLAMNCVVVLTVASLVSITGCGSEASLNTVPVTGTVTQDGQPVVGARVTYSPQGEGHAASGVTDASGVYTLMTETEGDGAVPGTYQVTITKYEEEEAAPAPVDPNDMDAIYAAMEEEGKDVTNPTGGRNEDEGPDNLLDDKYASPATSGLTATVTEEGENKNDFTIE